MLTGGAAVLVHSCTTDYGPDGIVVTQGIRQSLENNNSDTFSTPISVGSAVECEAFTVRTEKIEGRHWHDGVWGQNQSGTGRKGLCSIDEQVE